MGAARRFEAVRRPVVLLVLAPLAAVASTAAAEDDVSDAREHFRRGMRLIAEDQYAKGISELERAYELRPHPSVLYNIARAYTETGKYRKAIRYHERYLETDPPDRAKVEGFIEALRRQLERRKEQKQRQGAEGDPMAALEATIQQLDDINRVARSESLGGRIQLLRKLHEQLSAQEKWQQYEASEQQLTALDQSLQQIRRIAEAAQSATLKARGKRLRQLLKQLR